MIRRITENEFKEAYEVTLGVEFGALIFKINLNRILKLQIWDTAGQESFKAITKIFYRGTNCIFLCYDITRKVSLEHCEGWLNEVRLNAGNQIVVILVGTQADRVGSKEVTPDIAKEFVEKHKLDYWIETSAKANDNVDELFTLCA